MSETYDLVIRGGTIVDGNGGEPFEGDIGVSGGRIAAVGEVSGVGREEIDARGKIVTPGFVDIHTHYDGQVSWEQTMQPSSWHGVTTVVGGNCGVGFAPCKPDQRDMLVKLMEGVEDIPDVVMTAGLPWTWETFPEYLNFLGARSYDIDIGIHVPHSPIRVYVMGERGMRREPATPEEIEKMSELVEEGVRAGAIGVATSRFLNHRTRAGELSPTIGSPVEELLGLARGLKRAGRGVFQLVPDIYAPAANEYGVFKAIAEESGQPLSFSVLAHPRAPDAWRDYLKLLAEDQPKGTGRIRAQVYPRPVGLLFGLDCSFHPFSLNPSYRRIADLPLAEKVAEMRKPEVRAALLSEQAEDTNPFAKEQIELQREYYRMGDPPQYVPQPEDELGRVAEKAGISKAEVIYDALLEREGKAILYRPTSNYLGHNLDAARDLMADPNTILGLGDGGAHYGIICDASYPTFLLEYWVRDARSADRVPVQMAVKQLAADTADAVGLSDRGRLEPGLKADMNVIDLEKLKLHAPAMIQDLPANGKRLRQRADGYVASIVNGQVTYRDGVHTGALPGRLVRPQ